MKADGTGKARTTGREAVPVSREESAALERAAEAQDAEILRQAHRLYPRNPAVVVKEIADAEEAFRHHQRGRQPFPLDDRLLGDFLRTCPRGVNPLAAPSVWDLLHFWGGTLEADEFGLAANRRFHDRAALEDFVTALRERLPRFRRGRPPVGAARKVIDERAVRAAWADDAIVPEIIRRAKPPEHSRDKKEFLQRVRAVTGPGPWAAQIVGVLWRFRRIGRPGPFPFRKAELALWERLDPANRTALSRRLDSLERLRRRTQQKS